MSELKDLIEILIGAKDEVLLEDFLMGLTTAKERQEFAQRLEIMKRLIAGEPHHKIAADIGVGVATVTRGSKELAAGRFKILKEKYEKD